MITAKVRKRSKPLNAYKLQNKEVFNVDGKEVVGYAEDWVIVNEDGVHIPIDEKKFYDEYEVIQIVYKPSM